MYVYKLINLSLEPGPDSEHPWKRTDFATAANRWAEMGWRTVSAIPAPGPGYADSILVERWER